MTRFWSVRASALVLKRFEEKECIPKETVGRLEWMARRAKTNTLVCYLFSTQLLNLWPLRSHSRPFRRPLASLLAFLRYRWLFLYFYFHSCLLHCSPHWHLNNIHFYFSERARRCVRLWKRSAKEKEQRFFPSSSCRMPCLKRIKWQTDEIYFFSAIRTHKGINDDDETKISTKCNLYTQKERPSQVFRISGRDVALN